MGDDKRDMTNSTPEEKRRAPDAAEVMLHPDDAKRAELARASLARHRPLSALYGPEQLRADQGRELLSVASLPAWTRALTEDRAHATGHGLGYELDRALGGIGPGYLLGVAAASAKAGKTALIHQLADGCAMRSADLLLNDSKPGPVTPVVMLSEMTARDLTWRTLARWTGHPASWFRAGKSAIDLAGGDSERVAQMWAEAERLLSPGDSVNAVARERFSRVYDPRGDKGEALLGGLRVLVEAWREDLAQDPRLRGREVWPVVMVDPIQRHTDKSKGPVEAMDTFADQLNDVARANGWIVLITSDATKNSAMGGTRGTADKPVSPEEEGAAAFRGSYTLQHALDAALYLRAAPDAAERTDGFRELETVLVFNRWGPSGGQPPRFDFHARTMRMYPQHSESLSKGGARL